MLGLDEMASSSLSFCLVVFTISWAYCFGMTEDENAAQYLEGTNGYNKRAEIISNKYSLASWAYNTNITAENQKIMTELSLVVSEFAKNESKIAAMFNLSAMMNQSLKRQLGKVMDIGISEYENTDDLRKIADLQANMTAIYSSAKWCPSQGDCMALEPDLTNIMTNSRNYDELRNAWKGWRDVSGAKMRQQYTEWVALMNKAIKAGGKYEDMGDYYRSWYEQETFEEDVKNIFEELRPLYDHLHAYVRHKLKKTYGGDKFPTAGHIPAHILGNMWAQQWSNIYDLLEPYPGKGRESLTVEMKKQNYTIVKMYELAEDFFKSIDMQPMPKTFWNLSMLEKPSDREVVCHASAWDFSNGTDFRIKQCTTVTEDQLITVHHEMGHVEYFLEYLNQSKLFRDGANPGFHEAVADIVSLSFQTPEHLKEINLLDNLPNSTEGDINFLFQMALDKVAFLPFGYLIDQWRWSVYRGQITEKNYNAEWWKLRCQYQGVSPPVQRSESDFDPGAKFHVPANTPYIRYFVSFVLQFQWHKALCELIGKAERLHRCDIYKHAAAGQRLKEMLRMGSSKPWGEAMRVLTNGTKGETDKLSAKALLEYFKPLQEWLESENAKSGEQVGWDRKNCPEVSLSSGARTQSSIFAIVVYLPLICVLATIAEIAKSLQLGIVNLI